MIQVDVYENYRTFDTKDEVTFKTNFACSVCGNVNSIYIDVDNILICKKCLSEWIKILGDKYLDHIIEVEKERCRED